MERKIIRKFYGERNGMEYSFQNMSVKFLIQIVRNEMMEGIKIIISPNLLQI